MVDVLFGHFKVACINPFDKELFSKKSRYLIPDFVTHLPVQLVTFVGLDNYPNKHFEILGKVA